MDTQLLLDQIGQLVRNIFDEKLDKRLDAIEGEMKEIRKEILDMNHAVYRINLLEIRTNRHSERIENLEDRLEFIRS